MNMILANEPTDDRTIKPLPSSWYEGEECQMKTTVLDDFGTPIRLWKTTVFDAATRCVVATQLSPRPMDRAKLATLASARGGSFLSFVDPHRWALVFPLGSTTPIEDPDADIGHAATYAGFADEINAVGTAEVR